jgi:hypothetical protein
LYIGEHNAMNDSFE